MYVSLQAVSVFGCDWPYTNPSLPNPKLLTPAQHNVLSMWATQQAGRLLGHAPPMGVVQAGMLPSRIRGLAGRIQAAAVAAGILNLTMSRSPGILWESGRASRALGLKAACLVPVL